MQQRELDLREVFRITRRRFWLILTIPLLAATAAGIVSVYFLQPLYSSSSTIWVIKEGSGLTNMSDLQFNRSITKTYAEVAKSRAVMREVSNKLAAQGISVSGLQGRLVVTPVRDTEILSFTVVDPDPVMAAKLADAVAEVFRTQIRSYVKVDNVVVVDPAIVPSRPFTPRVPNNILLALAAGGVLAAALALLLEYLDTTVKSPDDVVRHLGVPVLGIIPAFEDTEVEKGRRRPKTGTRSLDAVVEK